MSDVPEKKKPAPESNEDAGRSNLPFYMMVLIFLFIAMWAYQAIVTATRTEVEYSFFLSQVKKDNVSSVVIKGLGIEGQWRNVKEAQADLEEILKQVKAEEDVRKKEKEALAKEQAVKSKTDATAEKAPVEIADQPEKKTDVATKIVAKEKATEEKFPQLADMFITEMPHQEDQTLIRLLAEHNTRIKASSGDFTALLTQSLIIALPFLLIMMFIMFMMRRSSDPMNSSMFGNFVKSPAKRFKVGEHKTTFKDVAGLEHAKIELQEVVEFLKEPEKFLKLGAEIPKGVLLMGSPGTGKTLMARAVAGEAEVPFFSINGSEFIQMFVGVGASRVRDMFKQAKDNSPCILFIDEIDAVGRVRGAGVGGGHDEREQTLNQILSEMDGFQATEAVIVMAATNRPDVLDPALLRPGRFDRHVAVDKPTREGREAILGVHVRKVPLGKDVDLKEIAGSTIGFSGAELKNLVNEAALHAARVDRTEVTREDFEQARDKIMMGVPREEIMNEKERRMTAYHEAGHAVLAWMLPEVDPVHKVTIVPRGRALGVTQLLPEEERMHMGEQRLRQQLAMMLGGRAAEKIVFDEYSAGAEDDLKRSSAIARRMVTSWGMSETIGPVAYRDGEEHPFLGKEMHEQRKYSDQTAFIIDQEMSKVMRDAQQVAMDKLKEHRDHLDAISEALLSQEIVQREQLEIIMGKKLPRD